MYDKQELITVVARAARDIFTSFDYIEDEFEYVDIRLQLLNGSYEIHTGDSQYDTDRRGAWGYGSVNLHPDSEQTWDEIAIEIVEDTLADYEQQQKLVDSLNK
ncbi:hypothetical protein [Scytonema sp. NUACC26]|uniref:hypothetical protein n=1 Tax=Scytonema sp. NUACC26 TaxID=3140176 RepID=UPI0034DBC096